MRRYEEFMHLNSETYLELLRLWFVDCHPADPGLQRTLRAIRRNRRKVPDPQALRAVFRAPTPDWSDAEIFRAWARLRRGPRPKVGRTSLMAERALGRRVGRPVRRGVPVTLWRDARDRLSRMIRSQRRGQVLEINAAELRDLHGCGVILTPSPEAPMQYHAPDGEARAQQGGPLWFELFWQEKLFWHAVGVAPPGLRKLVERLGVQSEYDQGIKRADRAATWFLEQVFWQAGRGWRPRSISARARREFETQADKMEAATREMERLAAHGGRPSRALIEVATSRLGVGRIDWEMP